MVPALRTAFNERWREERYQAFLDGIRQRVGVPVEFPISETPAFCHAIWWIRSAEPARS